MLRGIFRSERYEIKFIQEWFFVVWVISTVRVKGTRDISGEVHLLIETIT